MKYHLRLIKENKSYELVNILEWGIDFWAERKLVPL